MWVPPPMGVVPVYVPFFMRGKAGTHVDVLQACCGNAYRRSFFPDLLKLRQIPAGCFTTDDLWIAGYLATVSDIPRVIIPEREEPDQPPWKGLDMMQWRLSTINSKNMNDIKCINAVERTLGRWIPAVTRQTLGT